MDKEIQSPKNSKWQDYLSGVAVVFYILYRWGLKDPQIIKDMGVGYSLFTMVWVMVMFLAAGFSSWRVVVLVLDYAPKILKVINLIKKSDGD